MKTYRLTFILTLLTYFSYSQTLPELLKKAETNHPLLKAQERNIHFKRSIDYVHQADLSGI